MVVDKTVLSIEWWSICYKNYSNTKLETFQWTFFVASTATTKQSTFFIYVSFENLSQKNIFISMPGLSIFFISYLFQKFIFFENVNIQNCNFILDHLYLKEFRKFTLSWKKAILFYFQFVEFKKKLNIFGLEPNIYRIHSKMRIIKSVINHINLK